MGADSLASGEHLIAGRPEAQKKCEWCHQPIGLGTRYVIHSYYHYRPSGRRWVKHWGHRTCYEADQDRRAAEEAAEAQAQEKADRKRRVAWRRGWEEQHPPQEHTPVTLAPYYQGTDYWPRDRCVAEIEGITGLPLIEPEAIHELDLRAIAQAMESDKDKTIEELEDKVEQLEEDEQKLQERLEHLKGRAHQADVLEAQLEERDARIRALEDLTERMAELELRLLTLEPEGEANEP